VADEKKLLARIGDSVQCDLRHPYYHTITLKLENPEQVAYANDLLMNPKSGWRLVGAESAALSSSSEGKTE
jgi:hypothetical protein